MLHEVQLCKFNEKHYNQFMLRDMLTALHSFKFIYQTPYSVILIKDHVALVLYNEQIAISTPWRSHAIHINHQEKQTNLGILNILLHDLERLIQ